MEYEYEYVLEPDIEPVWAGGPEELVEAIVGWMTGFTLLTWDTVGLPPSHC